MKLIYNLLTFVLVVSILGAGTLNIGSASAAVGCYSPTGWFASEFILNKPSVNFNLTLIGETDNVTVVKSSVIYRSHYNEFVAVLLTSLDLFEEKGLDIRLQMPTKIKTITKQSLVLENNVTETKIIDLNMMGGRGSGWILDTSYMQLVPDQEPTRVSNLVKGNLKVTFIPLINETLLGINILVSAENTASLSNENITELSNIFDGIGYPISFSVLLGEFESKIFTEEEYDIESILGISSDDFNWFDAMKMELKWLRNNQVVTGLTDHDIEDIATLAKDAVAEHNFRGRYYDGNWVQGVSGEMVEAGVTQLFYGEADCDGFSSEILPTFSVQDFNTGFNPLEIISESSTQGQTIRMVLIGISILVVSVFVLRWRRRLKERKRREQLAT